MLILCWSILGLVLGADPRQTAPQGVGDVSKTVTFTTRDGKTYVDAKVSVTDTGLSVLTSDGGTTVPFSLLPDGLAVFPGYIAKRIVAFRSKAEERQDGESKQVESLPNHDGVAPENQSGNSLASGTIPNRTLQQTGSLSSSGSQPVASGSHDPFINGDLKEVEKCLKDNPKIIFAKDSDGDTPLHNASYGGSKDVVELLLTKGADVIAKDKDGMTPLFPAAGVVIGILWKFYYQRAPMLMQRTAME